MGKYDNLKYDINMQNYRIKCRGKYFRWVVILKNIIYKHNINVFDDYDLYQITYILEQHYKTKQALQRLGFTTTLDLITKIEALKYHNIIEHSYFEKCKKKVEK